MRYLKLRRYCGGHTVGKNVWGQQGRCPLSQPSFDTVGIQSTETNHFRPLIWFSKSIHLYNVGIESIQELDFHIVYHWNARSEPYDPYLPRNGTENGQPPPAGPSQGPNKTAAIQAQIDDTVGIMRENITKVAERGERLDALQDKTGTFGVHGRNCISMNYYFAH